MLGTMHMGRLVPKVSIPIMISMLVQALYNVVDGIFVARYSADAFTAVSLVFPIQMLMIAVGTGLGVGINSLVSRTWARAGRRPPGTPPATASFWSCAAGCCSACSASWERAPLCTCSPRISTCRPWAANT